tara:strand:+ start:84 stop:263 length:180 start_codon:yes stop_codon:yes gene_type:complete
VEAGSFNAALEFSPLFGQTHLPVLLLGKLLESHLAGKTSIPEDSLFDGIIYTGDIHNPL